ncbi:MAG: hypothetical protein WCP72_05980 [Desulfomonile sp.]
MDENIILSEEGCGCLKHEGSIVSQDCCDCKPKMALTFEEQGILDQLRLIKSVARATLADIKDIELRRFERDKSDRMSIEDEWLRLSQKLEEIRSRWTEWSSRLDAATERKLIMLGHREPRA